MNNGLKTIVATAAVAATIFAANFANAQGTSQQNAAAGKSLTGSPQMDAEGEKMSSEISKRLRDQPIERQRRLAAAKAFLGFYMINMRSRVEYCQEQSVDIHAFTDLLAQDNVKLLAVARSILASEKVDEEALYNTVKAGLRSALNASMNEIMTAYKTDAKGACQMVIANAAELTAILKLSIFQPDAYQILMNEA